MDIGCGWGALVIHAAKHYGVEAVRITLSENQYRWAQEWIRREGLKGKARVELRDYREMDEVEAFDKLVSVGMFEHVGEEVLPVYFQQAYRLLKPGSVFLTMLSPVTLIAPGNEALSAIARSSPTGSWFPSG